MSEYPSRSAAPASPGGGDARTVEVQVPAVQLDYRVCIAAGLLDRLGAEVRTVCPAAGRVALVSDVNVMPLHGPRARASLATVGLQVREFVVPAGEASKSPERLLALLDGMIAAGLARQDVVVALGGGVVGDLAGLAAALFMRGIAFVQCPTSLLAQVDASVGGKVAVDLPAGKNLMGAFHSPRVVLADPSVLATLPPGELACGLAEMLKHGALFSRAHFDDVVASADRVFAGEVEATAALVASSVRLKAACVAGDPREAHDGAGGRALLNLGHTIGHAIEQVSAFTVRHGEAVGLGMIAAARLSERHGEAPAVEPSGSVGSLEALFVASLAALRLPTDLDRWLAADREEALVRALAADKKRTSTQVSYIALAAIAAPRVIALTPDEIVALLRPASHRC